MPTASPRILKVTVIRGAITVHTQLPLGPHRTIDMRTILGSVNLRLYQKDEIWIRKKGALTCRNRPYTLDSTLNEKDHQECVIFISPDPPAPLPQLALPFPTPIMGPILTHPVPSASTPTPSPSPSSTVPSKRIRKKARSAIQRQKALQQLRRKKILAQQRKSGAKTMP